MKKLWMALGLALSASALAGCAAAIGGAAVIGADAIMEEERGGDGLF